MTQYDAAIPSCPSDHRWRGGARGGTPPSMSLAHLAVAQGYGVDAPSRIRGRGAPNEARPTPATTS